MRKTKKLKQLYGYRYRSQLGTLSQSLSRAPIADRAKHGSRQALRHVHWRLAWRARCPHDKRVLQKKTGMQGKRGAAQWSGSGARCGAVRCEAARTVASVWRSVATTQRAAVVKASRPAARAEATHAGECDAVQRGREARVRSMQCGAGCTWRSTHVWHSVATCSGARPSNCNLVHALHSEQAGGAGVSATRGAWPAARFGAARGSRGSTGSRGSEAGVRPVVEQRWGAGRVRCGAGAAVECALTQSYCTTLRAKRSEGGGVDLCGPAARLAGRCTVTRGVSCSIFNCNGKI